MVKRVSERMEILWRILIGFVSGIILYVWGHLICLLIVVHAFIVLLTGKRDKSLSRFCEYWNSEIYRYSRYMTFETNERPFPFTNLKRLGKFER